MLNKIEKLLKSLKTQVTLPSIKDLGKPLKTPEVSSSKVPDKTPGIAQASNKNPVKAAEQTQNKDIKDVKMKEAQEHLKINKSTGQWSL